MGEQKIKPYIRNAKYYETDQMRIIHHSNYIRWMEEARIDYLSQMGISCGKLEEMGIIIPVLTVSCEYRNMVRFDEDVIIEVKVVKYTSVKFELTYSFMNAATGILCTTGTSSHCFLNKDYRPISLKKNYPEIDAMFRKMVML